MAGHAMPGCPSQALDAVSRARVTRGWQLSHFSSLVAAKRDHSLGDDCMLAHPVEGRGKMTLAIRVINVACFALPLAFTLTRASQSGESVAASLPPLSLPLFSPAKEKAQFDSDPDCDFQDLFLSCCYCCCCLEIRRSNESSHSH